MDEGFPVIHSPILRLIDGREVVLSPRAVIGDVDALTFQFGYRAGYLLIEVRSKLCSAGVKGTVVRDAGEDGRIGRRILFQPFPQVFMS